jgi:hypothetical protein
MSNEKIDEKDEKQEEKTQEKTEEKTWEEKWERDPVGRLTWAAIFIWAGFVFLLSNLGILEQIVQTSSVTGITYLDSLISAWPLVLIGAGVIVLMDVLVRVLIPAYRRPLLGRIVIAVILIAIGLGDLVNWGIVWAVLLIIAGGAIILRAMRRQ